MLILMLVVKPDFGRDIGRGNNLIIG